MKPVLPFLQSQKNLIFAVFLFCNFIFVDKALADANSNLLRVRLEKGLETIKITGENIKVQGGDHYQLVAIPQDKQIEISRVLIKGKSFWQIKKQNKTEVIGQKYLQIEGLQLYSGSKSLPNKIFLSGKKSFDVIGILPIENYLVGVIASEMPLSWPIESLKAQAIAARSYALAVKKEREQKEFHLESNILDQVFRHVSQGIDQDPLIEKAFQAVKETEHMILTSQANQKVLKAFYHADCGGQTSPAKEVWGFGDAKTVVQDTSCPAGKKTNWNFEITKESLKEKFAHLNPMEIVTIQPVKSKGQRRASKVKIKWSDGVEKEILADTFRGTLGYQIFKSTLFDVTQNETKFSFRGRGYGHGVGLCQTGSKVLAQKNKNYREILGHYYPNAILQSRLEGQQNSDRK